MRAVLSALLLCQLSLLGTGLETCAADCEEQALRTAVQQEEAQLDSEAALELLQLRGAAVEPATVADLGHPRGLRNNRTANATPEAMLPHSMGNSTFSKMTEAGLLAARVNSTLDAVTEGELLAWLPPALQAADAASEVVAMPSNATTYATVRGSGNIMTLYHTTSHHVANIIVKTQHFKPGSSGFCGGAIYFMDTPNIPPTKIPPADGTHMQAVLEAKVDMGNIAVINGLCYGWQWARMMGYDTITFNPWDGQEYVVFDPSRVLSVRRYK